MAGKNLEENPHMKFFWEQQMKLLQTSKMGRRYHPQIIRFPLSLHAKSASAYRELQDSGALILPSERVLRDYKNYYKPKAGINKENVESLRGKISSFSEVEIINYEFEVNTPQCVVLCCLHCLIKGYDE